MNIHNINTPTKTVKVRGRPLKSSTPSDYCRICKTHFKVTLGNFSKYISTENIYNISKKACAEGISLRDLVTKTFGITVEKDENLSSRVCSKCAGKIRNAAKHASVVLENINVPHADFSREITTEEGELNVRFKRLSNSPGSRCQKRVKVFNSPNSKLNMPTDQASVTSDVAANKGCKRSSKRSLNLLLENSTINCDKENEDPTLPIDLDGDIRELFDNKTPRNLEVDVHLKYPSGLRLVHVNDITSKSLIKNVAQKNWKATVNIIFKHSECRAAVHEATRSKVSSEFKEYCHSDNSVLKYSSPAEIASYSNRLVKHEASVFCPLWSSAVQGAIGVVKSVTKISKATNVFALCTGAVARFRNNRMSALAHRVSVILLHSGAKSRDFLRLNRLGICMSHSETIKKQKEMGKSHDIQALMWKSEIEINKRCELFLREIKSNQIPVFEDNDMAYDVIINTSESTLSSYRYYSKQVYDICMAALRKDLAESDSITDDVLECCISSMSHEGISHPKYR